jgi:ribosomal protein L40E
MLIVFYLVGVLFYMLIVLTWWMDSSKKKFDQKQAERLKNAPPPVTGTGASKERKEKFVCSECGAEVPIDASKCPQCGEKFEDDGTTQKAIAPPSSTKPEEFVCSECGKTVKASDTKCWNCGKEFDE